MVSKRIIIQKEGQSVASYGVICVSRHPMTVVYFRPE